MRKLQSHSLSKRVLILDGNQRSALAATRSLGSKGIYVIVGDENKKNLSALSKYSRESFTYPSPYNEPLTFIEILKREISKRGIEVLFPMTDVTATLLLQNRSLFPDINIPFGDFDSYETLSNKWKLFNMAMGLSIPIPKTWFVKDLNTLRQIAGEFPFPVVIKPYRSRIFYGDKYVASNISYANSISELGGIIDGDSILREHPFLVQEKINGTGQGVFALYDHGEPLVFFAHRRLREKPPSGGVSVLCESIPINPKMKEMAQKLLDNVKWHGVAMVEFKVDREERPYLMEVNARFWGSLQLAIDAGMDFPSMLYQLSTGEKVERLDKYKIGFRNRWLLGDLDHLYLVLKNNSIQHITPFAKVRAIIQFFNFFGKDTRYEVNRWDDLMPFLFEFRQYLGKKG